MVAPTIEIRPLDDLAALDDAIDRLATFSWVAFTSQNAVNVFLPRLAQRNLTPGAVKIAAIGEQTANLLRTYGARVALVARQHVSEALANELIAVASRGERMLLVRALEGREILATMLEEAGMAITQVAVYRTVTAQDPAFAGKVNAVDTVTFTSASTVHGFAMLLRGHAADAVREKCVACIGPVTAQAARELGLHVDVVATHHTVAGLVTALRAHFGATP